MKIVGHEDLKRRLADLEDGAVVAVSGAGGGLLEPDEVLRDFEESFLATGRPRDLTLVHALGMGDRQQDRHQPLRARGHGEAGDRRPLDLVAADAETGAGEPIEAYCLPSGASDAPLPRDRRRAAGPFHPCRARHLRRSAPAGRPLQRRRGRAARRTHADRRTGCAALPALPGACRRDQRHVRRRATAISARSRSRPTSIPTRSRWRRRIAAESSLRRCARSCRPGVCARAR